MSRAACRGIREGSECQSPVEQALPRKTWQFVEEFQRLVGEDAEPDSLFFVESWTLGKPVALLNLKQRQLERTDRKSQSCFSGAPDGFGAPISETERVSMVDYASSAYSSTSTGSYKTGKWHDSPEEPVIEARWRTEKHSRGVHAEYFSSKELDGPMTQALACQLLGVTPSSTRNEIKAAYRQKVGQWHPDRLERNTKEMRQLATEKMTAINAAYRLLRSVRA